MVTHIAKLATAQTVSFWTLNSPPFFFFLAEPPREARCCSQQLLGVVRGPCHHVAQGLGRLLLDGGPVVLQELGQHVQHAHINGHLFLLICACDNIPHITERRGQDIEV